MTFLLLITHKVLVFQINPQATLEVIWKQEVIKIWAPHEFLIGGDYLAKTSVSVSYK